TFPGAATLTLTDNSGIPPADEITDALIPYPNPFVGETHLLAKIGQAQHIRLAMRDLTGRLVVQTELEAQPGLHLFRLTTGAAGVYILSLANGDKHYATRVISTEPAGGASQIHYLGTLPDESRLMKTLVMKSLHNGYALGYSPGDIIQYQCFRDTCSTILADKPAHSTTYEVQFASCTDQSGHHYPVVKIGEQLWMAENLAWLPEVSPPTIGGYPEKLYYVQGYYGTNPQEAAGLEAYEEYGVLYNNKAAQSACPVGWHLPWDADWQSLELELGMDEAEVDETGYRSSGSVGEKLKSFSGWIDGGNGDGSSGFNAKPAGNRNREGGFGTIGLSAGYWTSSASGSSVNFTRVINNDTGGITRGSATHNIGLSVRCIQK
ncbi:MAG: FISUMP domain-containing protein, partial [Bacteroidales bacterium]